jgi:hypothetical protein
MSGNTFRLSKMCLKPVFAKVAAKLKGFHITSPGSCNLLVWDEKVLIEEGKRICLPDYCGKMAV